MSMEPGAALPLDCINALEEAHSRGIRAWFRWSLSFILIQTSNLIEMTHELVNLFWIGKLNRNQRQHGHGTRMACRRLAEVPKRG